MGLDAGQGGTSSVRGRPATRPAHRHGAAHAAHALQTPNLWPMDVDLAAWWAMWNPQPLPDELVANYDAQGKRLLAWLVLTPADLPAMPNLWIRYRSDASALEMGSIASQCFDRGTDFAEFGPDSQQFEWGTRSDGTYEVCLLSMGVEEFGVAH